MPAPPQEARRGFLKLVTAAVTGVIAALTAVPGLGLLMHPLRRRTVAGADEPLPVAAVSDLEMGRPLRVNVFGKIRDGWLRLDRVKLGAVWLIRTSEGRVRAFSSACPHLGCGVDWDESTEKFACPCHRSSFDMDGRCLFGPAPRGLDELEVVTSADEVRVRYRRFRLATKDKEPIG
jgi:menaquinol-cytochrome c reductase iron-sulfur subunit